MIVLVLALVVVSSLLAGMHASLGRSSIVPLGACVLCELFATNTFNPLFLMVSVGPWAVGATLRSKRRIASELSTLAQQLEDGREHFAAEQLRYQRVRLARELHDTVAHWVTAVVVQATAGQLLLNSDPSRVSETFGHIEQAAQRASGEVKRAADLMGLPGQEAPSGTNLVDELTSVASISGATLVLDFSVDELSSDLSTLVLRIVQEGITNALKHAPRSTVRVSVQSKSSRLYITISNGAAMGPSREGYDQGTGWGLDGLRSRVHEHAGQFEAGPTPGDGWAIRATFSL
jgi:signal transduction histidine kinase